MHPCRSGGQFHPYFKGGQRGVVTTGGRLSRRCEGGLMPAATLPLLGTAAGPLRGAAARLSDLHVGVRHFCRPWMGKCRGRTGGAIVPGPHPVSRPPGRGVAVGPHCRVGLATFLMRPKRWRQKAAAQTGRLSTSVSSSALPTSCGSPGRLAAHAPRGLLSG